MANKQFTIHKIIKTAAAREIQSHDTIDNYNRLNQAADEASEFSLQYMLQATRLRQNGQLVEALQYLDKALANAQGDLDLKLRAERAINEICEIAENLALEDVGDVRIGPLYEYFLLRGRLGIYFHAYAALHYRKIGEFVRAKDILTKFKAVAPNFKLFKTKE